MWRFLTDLFRRSPPAPELIHPPPAEFAKDPAPDWLLEWDGALLPGGGHFRGRLALGGDAPQLAAEVEYPVSRRNPQPPRLVPLNEVVLGRLLRALRAFPDGLVSVPWMCCDGIPLNVSVYRREPYAGVRAHCNLCDAFDLVSPASQPGGATTAQRSLAEQVDEAVAAGKPVAGVFHLGFMLLELTLAAGRDPGAPGGAPAT